MENEEIQETKKLKSVRELDCRKNLACDGRRG